MAEDERIPAWEDPDYWEYSQITPPNGFLEWLKLQSPDTWHQVRQTSFDGDEEILLWVISNPACELATALAILWQGLPSDSLKTYLDDPSVLDLEYNPEAVPTGRKGTFLVHREIITRLNSGFYKSREIAFSSDLIEHPAHNSRMMQEIDAAGLRRPWNLPDWAYQPFPGRQAKSIYSISNDYSINWDMDYWSENKPRLMPPSLAKH